MTETQEQVLRILRLQPEYGFTAKYIHDNIKSLNEITETHTGTKTPTPTLNEVIVACNAALNSGRAYAMMQNNDMETYYSITKHGLAHISEKYPLFKVIE